MKIPLQNLADVAALVKAKFIGDPNHPVTGINEVHIVESGDLVFVDHPKYYEKALLSPATTILINTEKVVCPPGKALIISDDPFRDYNKLVSYFHPKAYVTSPSVQEPKVGKNTVVMPGAFLGKNVIVGSDCVIFPNVVIYDNCRIGNNVVIHANTVIGSDAFYYKRRPSGLDKLISCGRVIIHDHVEIGACCTIDKGVSGDTVIGEGTKIDNQVQIGHDTVIGKMCLFASGVGIAGVCVIEDNVTLWGQVGVKSDVRLGKGCIVLAQSGVGDDIPPGKTWFGSPAGEASEKMKELFLVRRIPDILERLNR
ncbi:MAG TPA: UDP-3-O-(3-hydroxymyristoyl)glucosamine N-acyltransferase [Bacteroidia bacterium]|jgi:UDP-3-O-[3-hydroxymyristoyl] glucosamine N-acyltransferase|nr:UDP-3-O-(3-hydroxymyristoyl)glucosamine N-acyltransferase [Bacteroidia bacterium]